jgi:hypothetical protein
MTRRLLRPRSAVVLLFVFLSGLALRASHMESVQGKRTAATS